MLIVSIEESRSYKGRLEIVFDDGLRLMTSKDVIAENYLHVGKELAEREIESLKDGFIRDETRNLAVSLVEWRPMSRREVEKKLIEKGQPKENAMEAACWLEEIGLIDDSEYACLIVRHYSGKGYGVRRIKAELYRRGVPQELWDEAIIDMPEQEEEVFGFIQSSLGGRLPDQREKKRVFDKLARRGFSYGEINSAFRRYEEYTAEEGNEY